MFNDSFTLSSSKYIDNYVNPSEQYVEIRDSLLEISPKVNINEGEKSVSEESASATFLDGIV
jgi:hypothetical protein